MQRVAFYQGVTHAYVINIDQTTMIQTRAALPLRQISKSDLATNGRDQTRQALPHTNYLFLFMQNVNRNLNPYNPVPLRIEVRLK